VYQGEAKKMTQETTKDKDYTKRLEDAFKRIMSGYAEVVPQYKSDIESLRERLENIRDFTNKASSARYLKNAQPEVILANLITQILGEADEIDKLKPLQETKAGEMTKKDFFEVLAGSKELKLDEALSGFEFFDNNPYRKKAEKRLEKIKSKKGKKV
jgi:ribosome-binding ATPase YchF (GTP1/OBG family)